MSSFFKFAAIVVGATAVGATVATVVARRRCSASSATIPAAVPAPTPAPAAAQKTQAGKFDPVFLNLWERAKNVDFSSTWNNGTGYLNGAVSDEQFNTYPTGVWRFTTDNARKGIIIKDNTGLYVVFQRYTDCKEQLVMNCSFRNSSDLTVKLLLKKAEGLMPQVS